MARMPFPTEKQSWSAGHFMRKVPDGYADAAIDEGRLAMRISRHIGRS